MMLNDYKAIYVVSKDGDGRPPREKVMMRVEFTFGHTTKEGAALSKQQILEARRYLYQCIYQVNKSGARGLEHQGVYGDGDGELISEDSTTIQAYVDVADLEALWPVLREAAADVAEYLNQSSVLLTAEVVNGRVEFVTPRQPAYKRSQGVGKAPLNGLVDTTHEMR